MSVPGTLVLSTLLLCGAPALLGAADIARSDGDRCRAEPRVGEVRTLAIGPDSVNAIAALHRDGWLQAEGQLLSSREFPELYGTIGRAWTADGVAEGMFAVPEMHDRSQRRVSSDNPFGVLGPGDLVSGGRQLKAWEREAPLAYWIYVGRDTSHVGFEPDTGH